MIEVTTDMEYIYRVNEFNNREVMRRKNKPYARWKHHQWMATPEAARNAILSLQKEDDSDE